MGPLMNADHFSNFVADSIEFALRDGKKIEFWSIKWILGMVLRVAFPRIYALVPNKSGKVSEFGRFLNNEWKWMVSLRQDLFDWEKEQWEQFWCLINKFQVCQTLLDFLIWKGLVDEKFSVRRCCYDFINQNSGNNSVWKELWGSSASPKVINFCWRVLRMRIAVKMELANRNLLNMDNALCVFCKVEVESIEHLFFQCKFSWNLWMYWASFWGIVWCTPSKPVVFFLSWPDAIPEGQCDKLWRMMFFFTTWTLWLVRNDMVFNGSSPAFENVVDLCKYRLATWSKARWPMIAEGLMILCCRGNISWSPPANEVLKFNVDGATQGQPGFAGRGGVLRDRAGRCKILFSKSIGVADSNFAELSVVKEAFKLFSSSKWGKNHNLEIESDSRIVVHWISYPVQAPWRLRSILVDVENLKKMVPYWPVRHIFREANQTTDALAKLGIHRLQELLIISDD
ncbi:hypothetical protein PTKIN_Ptkin16aG0010100 [Pterospermum kingtungense]